MTFFNLFILYLTFLSLSKCDYEVESFTEKSVTYYIPKDADVTDGIIFYLGTAITPKKYDYIATFLASKGYLVALPNNLFAYILYSITETQTKAVLNKFPNIKFFLAGHSQGGGAATKMTNTMMNDIYGTILLSPLSYEKDSIKSTGLPVLFFEAQNDKVLSSSQKAESKKTLPEDAELVYLEGCNHMGYSDMSFFADGKCTIGIENQQKITADKMLEFMNLLTVKN